MNDEFPVFFKAWFLFVAIMAIAWLGIVGWGVVTLIEWVVTK